MRHSLALPAVLLGIFASGAAFAGSAEKGPIQAHQRASYTDAYDMGIVTEIDAASRSITLADGNRYVLPGYVNVNTLAKGDRVSIAFDESADGRVAEVRSVSML